jgi:hypothetical protein
MLEAIDKYAGGVFNPDDVRILVAAFDDASQSLLASGITFESDRESDAVRDTLAKHIIEQARYGERAGVRRSQLAGGRAHASATGGSNAHTPIRTKNQTSGDNRHQTSIEETDV